MVFFGMEILVADNAVGSIIAFDAERRMTIWGTFWAEKRRCTVL